MRQWRKNEEQTVQWWKDDDAGDHPEATQPSKQSLANWEQGGEKEWTQWSTNGEKHEQSAEQVGTKQFPTPR